MSRRALLVGASTVALASTALGRALLGPAAGERTLAGLLAVPGPRISIGFLDGLTGGAPGPGLDLSGRPQVVPAAGLRRDRALGGTATARIAGPTPGVLEDLPFAGVHLDALFAAPAGGEPLRHHAWSLTTNPVVASSPVRFAAPVGPASVGFSLRTVPHAGEGRDAVGVMTGGDEHDLPGLRPGTYLLGLGEGVWDAPGRLPDPADRAWDELASLAVTFSPR